jgi:protease-4
MKNFFTSFFASISALIVFALGGCLLVFLLLGALVAMGQKKPVEVENGAYVVFDLSANILDTPDQNEGFDEFMEAFGGESRSRLQLRQVTRAIRAAANDKAVKGLYLTGSFRPLGYGSGFAALKEVREAIMEFRASGKPVTAYINYADTRDFYLASAASEVVLDPYGAVVIPGLASQPMFFAGAFEKFGVGVQVTRVGKYKSAVEPYTRKDMSPENREQIQKLIDDLWKEITVTIEDARGFPAGSLQKLVDAKGFIRADAALQAKLVDRVAYLDEVLDDLKVKTGRKVSDRTFKQINLKSYAKLVGGAGKPVRESAPEKIELGASGRGKIAIVYAEGEIVDGDGNEEGFLYGGKTARLLREVRDDDNVKAVVLRVNSPGGSVSASEEIAREVMLLQKTRPVIISMGTLAASGGYWISTPGERIFAEPTTITGSIGVFGLFLNFQGLLNDKIGLTFDLVKTGKFADAATVTRPKTAEELALFQDSVDWVYDQFLTKVVQSRKLDRAVVEEIAQGRVWSGREAQKLGLVDELGGLDDAVKYAAAHANLGENFRVAEYPRRKQFAEAFTEALEGRHREQSFAGPAGVLVREASEQLKVLNTLNDPQGLYARLPFDLSLR